MLDFLGKYQTELTGLFVIIILGAIGTAFWEVILKPPSSWLLRKLLSAATFGLNRAKIIIYKRIAAAQEESFSHFIAFYLIMILCCAAIIFVLDFKYKFIDDIKNKYEKISSLEKNNEELINHSTKENITTFDKNETIKQNALKTREEINKLKINIINLENECNRFIILLILFLIILLIKLWFEYVTIVYVNSAIRYFNQLFTICAPLINEADRLKYRSEFARIKSPKEYKNLIECLKRIATKHEFDVPGFWVWGYKE